MPYQTIKAEVRDNICYLQLNRPEANNSINAELVKECHDALSACAESASVVVLSGAPGVFCVGADFDAIASKAAQNAEPDDIAEPLYDLWLRLAAGPSVTVSLVRGKVNAGGIGFVAASDVVLADDSARFSLSEMLFGLYPACVLPFLVRRIGFQRAHYLTLTTAPISAKQAQEWGLVDCCGEAEELLQRSLMRLRRLSKRAIQQYKEYVGKILTPLEEVRPLAVAANRSLLRDPKNLRAIARYVELAIFPWEDMPEHRAAASS